MLNEGMMSWIDLGIVVIIVFSALISVVRGFVREAVSLFAWIVAVWMTLHYAHAGADKLVGFIHSSTLRFILSAMGLFFGVMLVSSLVNTVLGRLLDITGLNGTDHLLGIAFGAARGILLVGILLLVCRITIPPTDHFWKHSVLITYFNPLEQWLHDLLPEGKPAFELHAKDF